MPAGGQGVLPAHRPCPPQPTGRSSCEAIPADFGVLSTHLVSEPPVTSVTLPKSILAKPSSTPEPRYLLSVPPSPGLGSSEPRSPPEGDTTLFLSRLSPIWKGFINMQSVAKFVTKAYPVSGSFDYLSEPGPGLAVQEAPLGCAPYEGPRHAHFADRGDNPVPDAEGDRGRPGEGPPLFPHPGPKAGPLPQLPGPREPAPRPFGVPGLHGPGFPGPRGPAPPFPEEGLVPSNDGPRGPPPARFGTQKGPIPSLFSGQHGPAPYGDPRGAAPSYLGGPRGAAPPQLEDRKDPHGEKREFQDPPYSEMAGPPGQFEGPEPAQFMGSRGPAPFQFGGQRRPLLSQFKGPRGGPPPAQFGGQRGPPPGHFLGPRGPHPPQFETARGPHPGQFEGPRGQAPSFLPGPRGMQPQQFEEQRVHSPPRFANQRAPAPLPFGGPRGSAPFPDSSEPAPPRFHFQGPAAQAGTLGPAHHGARSPRLQPGAGPPGAR
ncbi:PREDICTED: death-inducer obliterator 1 [Condylura cristata]|uniref:death-inducer obliterator 1 n=1 Tax=Condylura cristata TaxID=143302 RepID=UPI0006431F0A|nr:PREDICTED: death-inducer obliterator 1 [Condylura cristata]